MRSPPSSSRPPRARRVVQSGPSPVSLESPIMPAIPATVRSAMGGAPAHREAVYRLIALRWGGAAGLAAWNGSVSGGGDGKSQRGGLDRFAPPYALIALRWGGAAGLVRSRPPYGFGGARLTATCGMVP